ncbi:hypothetical protein Q4543_02330 [Salipiger sp. 1_MG-2023]|uniref:hypothetical protein n=1 Tax=Salipiger sp. 1_MG-2023 TaxID=3062665 RepID=UPI0026E4519E|nr:hypothetical protein [Salipiger sp. 1_MG-2023]MDO6584343.1 hypothetical protein [Salipiger sp. 1_MG-2023]
MTAARPERDTYVRLVFGKDAMLGLGKAELLSSVRDTGSIAAAGRAMAMRDKRAMQPCRRDERRAERRAGRVQVLQQCGTLEQQGWGLCRRWISRWPCRAIFPLGINACGRAAAMPI